MTRIDITPIPASRPRFSSKGAYNAPKYTNYKKALATYLRVFTKHKPIEKPLHLEIIFYLPIPKMSKKKILEHENAWHYKKPDKDNLEKAFMDAANGILWVDDNIVASTVSKKLYSQAPRIEYEVKEL